MKPDLKSSYEVADEIGVPYRTLMRWCAAGLITPHRIGTSPKSALLWAPEHVERARMVMLARGIRSDTFERLGRALVPVSGQSEWHKGWNDAMWYIRGILEVECLDEERARAERSS